MVRGRVRVRVRVRVGLAAGWRRLASWVGRPGVTHSRCTRGSGLRVQVALGAWLAAACEMLHAERGVARAFSSSGVGSVSSIGWISSIGWTSTNEALAKYSCGAKTVAAPVTAKKSAEASEKSPCGIVGF